MLQESPIRATYAQQRLLELLKNHQLKKWCDDNGLAHAYVYRLAYGEIPPTYRAISSMCHLIAPIEWLFYADEELPYEAKTVAQWDYKKTSKYVKEHKLNYKSIAEKYGLDETKAYNIFGLNRTFPSVEFIHQVAANKDGDPIDFFTELDTLVPNQYIPSAGDIVSSNGYVYFLFGTKNVNDTLYCYGCKIISKEEDLSDVNLSLDKEIKSRSITVKVISPLQINTFIFNKDDMQLIDKCSDIVLDQVKDKVKNIIFTLN